MKVTEEPVIQTRLVMWMKWLDSLWGSLGYEDRRDLRRTLSEAHAFIAYAARENRRLVRNAERENSSK